MESRRRTMKKSYLSLPLVAGLLVAASAPPVPTSAPSTWITADDYPYEAMLLEQEGRVTATLSLAANGLPVDCRIAVSSGFSSLDAQTCKALMMRARFEPIREKSKSAVPATYTMRLNWRLPTRGTPMTPTLDIHVMRLDFFVEPDGSISDCTAKLNENMPLPPQFCEAQIRGRRFVPQHDANGTPVRQKMRMTISVEKAD